jgi:hypothetical protein
MRIQNPKGDTNDNTFDAVYHPGRCPGDRRVRQLEHAKAGEQQREPSGGDHEPARQ